MKRKTDNFSKFYTKKNNAAIKEAFRQEKKAEKKARKEGIERHFEEKRKAREERFAAGNNASPMAGKPAAPSGKSFVPSGKQDAPSGKSGVPVSGGKPAPGKSVSAGKPALVSGKAAPVSGKPAPGKPGAPAPAPKGAAPQDPHTLPLNKYIAHGGICSRRDAADLIRLGKVQVNGQTVTEPGTKVFPEDEVKVSGKKVTISRNFVYILLNKPKDYITTTDDPQGRRTVLDLIRPATTERVFPVGRLDRNTSGVLLLTNDGDLAQKLAHPKHEIKKIYHVTLDKPLIKADFDKIAAGIELEDGIAYVDVLAYADSKDKTQIGLEIHSGRNRIVRRIFEHLGYDVRGLDRVMYAGLTKKNVQRGHWRMLTEKEIRILKYLNSSFRGSLSAPKAHAAPTVPDMDSDEDWVEITGEEKTFDTPAARESGKFGAGGTRKSSAGGEGKFAAGGEGKFAAGGEGKSHPHGAGSGPKKFKRPYSGRPDPGAGSEPAIGSEWNDHEDRGPQKPRQFNASPGSRKPQQFNASPGSRKPQQFSASPGSRKPRPFGAGTGPKKSRPSTAGSEKPKAPSESPRGRKSSGSYNKSKFTSREDVAPGGRKGKSGDRKPKFGDRKPKSFDQRDEASGARKSKFPGKRDGDHGSRKPKSFGQRGGAPGHDKSRSSAPGSERPRSSTPGSRKPASKKPFGRRPH